MGFTIIWRKAETEHTGSVEANDVPGEPTVFMHPRDNSAPGNEPRRSSAVSLTYNHDDAGEATVAGNEFELTCESRVSYTTYERVWRAWWALPASDRPSGMFRGQEASQEVFHAGLGSDLQLSGWVTYSAWLSCDPAASQDKQVSLTAVIKLLARSQGSSEAVFDGGKTMNTSASLWKGENNEFRYVQTSATTKDDLDESEDTHTETYTVTVPAGGATKIGHVRVGPGFRIEKGHVDVFASSKIAFTPHDNVRPDDIHENCRHIDTGTEEPDGEGKSGGKK